MRRGRKSLTTISCAIIGAILLASSFSAFAALKFQLHLTGDRNDTTSPVAEERNEIDGASSSLNRGDPTLRAALLTAPPRQGSCVVLTCNSDLVGLASGTAAAELTPGL